MQNEDGNKGVQFGFVLSKNFPLKDFTDKKSKDPNGHFASYCGYLVYPTTVQRDIRSKLIVGQVVAQPFNSQLGTPFLFAARSFDEAKYDSFVAQIKYNYIVL